MGQLKEKRNRRRNLFNSVSFPTFSPKPNWALAKNNVKILPKKNLQFFFLIEFKNIDFETNTLKIIITQRNHRIVISEHQSSEKNHLSTKIDRFHIKGNGVVWILHGRGSPVSESPKPLSLLSLLPFPLCPLREKEALASMAHIRSDSLLTVR